MDQTLKLTPMLQQYLDIKGQNPDCLLLFRLGDFYELFFEDALQAAPALDIVLTRRGKKEGQDIPMCGIPFHAADSYVARLIHKGFKIALCEQLEAPEDAKKRGAQAIVRRDVVRILTPGTLTEESLLNARQNNFLVCLAGKGKSLGLAAVDISTGDFVLESITLEEIDTALSRFNPKEILLSQSLFNRIESKLTPWKSPLSFQSESRFDAMNGHQKLLETFRVSTLEGFGSFSSEELMAGGAVLDYVTLTQKGKLPIFSAPKQRTASGSLQIDASTRQNLEIHQTLRGEFQGSLLHAIDHTITAGGGRLLGQRLANPLTHLEEIKKRQGAVTWFLKHESILEDVRIILKKAPDLERILGRVALGRAGPRDLGGIRNALTVTQAIQCLLPTPLGSDSELDFLRDNLPSYDSIVTMLETTLGDDLPLLAREGGFIASHVSKELDELRCLRDEGKKILIDLQNRYSQEAKIPSLKIKHNHMLGYYIEVTSVHKDKVPSTFIHRQTLVNGFRYTTVELSELEQKLTSAADQALALELEIFDTLVRTVLEQQEKLLKASTFLAVVDVASGLALLARQQSFCAPVLDESRQIVIEKGRHPIVESSLKDQSMIFTPNDCSLTDQDRFWLITGPNMAGKSTFLRQTALIILLAQMGSYVPASSVHIGIVDRIFSRVGASDDLARGRSTFMVEMVETATILHQATSQSFVILDEIGRGTATYDGLSLAWATAEYLYHTNQCRTLFATHYHEMGDLKKTLPALSCHTMRIKEWEGKIIFLHEIISGQTDRSYGIHVASLAGLPKPVIDRSQEILASLEKKGRESKKDSESLPLFTYTPSPKNQIEEKLRKIDIDSLSPREALEVLYDLKGDL